LISRSLVNATRRRLRRLKEPRYLIGAVFGLLYFYSIFARQKWQHAPDPRGGIMEPFFGEVAGIGILMVVLFNLAFGRSDAPLRYSEAEVDLLFPAPLTRRQLVNYKLLVVQPALVFTAAISALLGSGVATVGAVVPRAVGAWIVYTTLHLHFTAMAFARVNLAEHGLTGLRRRFVFVGVAAIVVAFVARAGWTSFGRMIDAFAAGAEVRRAALDELTSSSTLRAVLFLPRTLVGPAVAPTFGAFLRQLPGALAIAGLHYAWVLFSAVAFEEIAAEAASRRARARARGPGGQVMAGTAGSRRTIARLSPAGSPLAAIAWKNLTGFVRGSRVTIRTIVFLAIVVISFGMSFGLKGKRESIAALVAACLFFATGLLPVLGPLVVRLDLREDLVMLDVLKVYPLRGAEIVAGEVLGSLAVLSSLTLTCLIGGYVALALPSRVQLFAPNFSIFLAVLILTAPVQLVLILIQNAAAMLFPAWVSFGPDRATGIEAFGQRLVFMVGSMIAATILVAPAAALAGLAFALLGGVTGALSWIVAALLAAAILCAEAGAAILYLGRLFERLDPTTAGIA